MSICTVDGCDNKVRARGLCPTHYMRMRDGRDLNNQHGRGVAPVLILKSLLKYTDDCVAWPYAKNPQGYAIYDTGDGGQQLCRILCEIKNGPPPTKEHEAAHSCGNGRHACFNWRHLYWATRLQNGADKVAHGHSLKGSSNANSKLTEAQVSEIKSLIKDGRTITSIAAQFGMSISPISAIKTGKTWKHV